mgnify:CR=1 FL=1
MGGGGSSPYLTAQTRMLASMSLLEVLPLQNQGMTLHPAGCGKYAGVFQKGCGGQTREVGHHLEERRCVAGKG